MNKIIKHQLKVLLVSSDRKFYGLAKRLFGEFCEKRCEIEWRKSAQIALNSLNSGNHDVCFIDYRFVPDTGLTLLHKAILKGCRTPIILLTDEVDDEKLHIEAMRIGAAFCLSKEKLNPELLEQAVGYAVERVSTLSELRENVTKFRKLVETLPVMIYAAEPTPPYSPIYISPAFKLFGYPLEEWNSSEDFWVRLLHPEDSERILKETEKMMNSGRETDLEYRVIAKNGKVHWVHDRGHFVRDNKGKLVCWQGVILDITARKRAEKALRNSEAQFKIAFEEAAVGMAISSLDGRWMQVNQQLCEMLGYKKEELINHRFAEVTHPDDVQEEFDSRLDFLSGETRTFQREKRFIHKQGHIIWGYLSVSMVCDEHNNPSHFIAEIQDITERKLAVEALLESEARYRDIFENANDLIYTRDLEGNFTSLNRAGEIVTGYTRQEILKMDTRQIIASDYLEEAQQIVSRENSDEPSPVYELVIISKQGQRITLELSPRMIMQNGKPVGVQGIARDITERKRAERLLQASEADLKDLFDNAPTGYHELDSEGRIVRINRTELEMLGYELEEVIGKFGWDFVVEPVSRESVLKKLSGKIPLKEMERTFRRKDGSLLPVLLRDTLIRDKHGSITGIRANIQDITEQKRTEKALKDSEQQYRLLGEGIMHQIWTAQPNGQINYVNKRTLEYFGRISSDMLGNGWQNAVHPEDLVKCIRTWSHSLETGEDYETEFRLRRHDGRYFWFQARATAGRDAEGNIINWFGTNTDIDDRKKAEAKLTYFAGHDALTNLPNRARFMNHLERAVKRAEHNADFRFAVLFLDLDRFKIINDSLGHSIGDKLLIEIAERLEECLRPNDIVARLGGDEFTVLLTRINEPSDAVRVADRFLERLAAPFKLDNYEVFTSASIGIIVSDEVKRQPEDFLRDADTAMYRAKEAGKARYEIFDREMHIRNINLLQMENDLRRAIEQNEFRVFYQPIVELATGAIHEFEALIRWQHPQRGLVAPNDFIGIAEETGLIIPIGKWILEAACRQTADWQKRFPKYERLSISVNLSAKQLLHPNLIAQVEEVLEQTAFNPHFLQLEVTESMVMENGEKSLAVISGLRELGASISTDDFGTGYSSLSYLHQFPFDRLKIDRSFVSKMDSDQKSEAIVRTILLLAQNLNIEVIAEGIETEPQLVSLKHLGCKTGQGYFFSKPVPAEAAEQLLSKGLQNNKTESFYGYSEAKNPPLLELDKIQ